MKRFYLILFVVSLIATVAFFLFMPMSGGKKYAPAPRMCDEEMAEEGPGGSGFVPDLVLSPMKERKPSIFSQILDHIEKIVSILVSMTSLLMWNRERKKNRKGATA